MGRTSNVSHAQPIRIGLSVEPRVEHLLRLGVLVAIELVADNFECVRVDCGLQAESRCHSSTATPARGTGTAVATVTRQMVSGSL
jgi:hypothetical protein